MDAQPAFPPLGSKGSAPAYRRWRLESMHRIGLAVVLFITALGGAHAHTGGTIGFATVTVRGTTVRYSLSLGAAALTPELADAMHPGQPGFAPDYRPLLTLVEQKVRVSADGSQCERTSGSLIPPPNQGASIVIVLDFACASTPNELALRDDLFDALGVSYHTLANIVWNGGSQQFVFQPDIREAHITIQAGASARGAWSFFTLGIQHILIGFDHLLFLLALVLRGGDLWSLLKIVTAFTLAHSITLALAVLNVVVLPSRLVEATIALSIAYVAAENLFLRQAVSHRWAVSFLFGLVHGFGFSSVLRELGLPMQGLAWSLLSFNLGVEVGQATAITLILPALLWVRRSKWEPRAVAALSGVVLVVGLALFIERALLSG